MDKFIISSSISAVLFALFSNIFLFIGKFIVAIISGSAGLMAESFHSLSDTLNQLLLFLGFKRSSIKDKLNFPFGKGKEQYFWSFIASILFIEFSGFVSILEGYLKMQHPYIIKDVHFVYLIILLSFLLDGSALIYTIKILRKKIRESNYKTIREYLKNIRDSIIINAFMEELGALIGIFIILIGIILTQVLNNFIYDSISSFGVGILLIIIGIYLAKVSKDLLIGKGLTSNDRDRIIKILKEIENINYIINIDGIYMGPNTVILGLDLNFKDGLSTEDIEKTIDKHRKKD
ncbi:MAG: cation diffusion facilitator family transporter [Thermoplasmata archaeon]